MLLSVKLGVGPSKKWPVELHPKVTPLRHYHAYAWDVHCLGGSFTVLCPCLRPFPHDTMKCVPLRASAWASFLTCVEKRLVQVYPSSHFCPHHHMHTHMHQQAPRYNLGIELRGLNFNRNLLIIPSAHSLPLL